jgi:hypothetical protein
MLYTNEWLSFSCAAFPQNANADSGDPVTVCFRDRMDEPVTDILWTDRDHRENFEASGFDLLEVHRPLAGPDDPEEWISERAIPAWVIYVLSRSRPPA